MAPALIPPTVTAVGANHSGLSDATKPVLTETSKSIKETVNSDDTILGVPKWALVVAATPHHHFSNSSDPIGVHFLI